jgi:hypothetical protein
MPGRDQTGPMGMGAMTGRGAGICAGVGMPGYETAGPGRGFGMGYGRRRRNRFYATGIPGWMRFSGRYAGPYQNLDSGMERQSLKNQAEALQSELNAIKKRLSEIDPGTSAE